MYSSPVPIPVPSIGCGSVGGRGDGGWDTMMKGSRLRIGLDRMLLLELFVVLELELFVVLELLELVVVGLWMMKGMILLLLLLLMDVVVVAEK